MSIYFTWNLKLFIHNIVIDCVNVFIYSEILKYRQDAVMIVIELLPTSIEIKFVGMSYQLSFLSFKKLLPSDFFVSVINEATTNFWQLLSHFISYRFQDFRYDFLIINYYHSNKSRRVILFFVDCNRHGNSFCTFLIILFLEGNEFTFTQSSYESPTHTAATEFLNWMFMFIK